MTGAPDNAPARPGAGARPVPRRAILAGTVLLFVAGLAVLVYALVRIDEQLERAATAQSDNATWVLAQLEVDYLNFLRAMDTAEEAGDLGEVRLAFDILYSRVALIRNSDALDRLIGEVGILSQLDSVMAFLDSQTAAIDGPDAGLAAALPELQRRTLAFDTVMREVPVAAMNAIVAVSETRRAQLSTLLKTFSVFAFILLVTMALFALWTLHQRRIANERAIQSERTSSNFRTMIEASLDAVIVSDADGRVTHYNSAAAKIFGYPASQSIGGQMSEMIIPEATRPMHDAGMRRFLAGGPSRVINAGRLTLTAMRAGGTEFPAEVTVASDTDEVGAPIFIGYVRDISERVATERQLTEARDAAQRSEQVKSRFLAVMSHELRTPLTGLTAALDLALDTAPDDPVLQNYLSTARLCSDSALEQISDILELIRLEDAGRDEPRASFDAVAVLEQLLAQMRPLAQERNTRIRLSRPSGTVPVFGVRRLYSNALRNLLSNAVKFTTDGEIHVALHIDREGDTPRLRVEVADTGIGIPADQVHRIFENFERIDTGYSRATEGSGLGLSIARRAVERMGGAIQVESAEGQGSRFWFDLPLGDPAPDLPETDLAPVADAAAAPRVTGPRRVLVAEDNDITRRLLVDMLTGMGHVVLQARNGAEAVDKAVADPPDVALLDISMPVVDGLTARAEIAARFGPAAPPMIALTAHGMPEDLARFRAAGFDDVAVKPIKRAALAGLVAGAASGTGTAAGTRKDDTSRPILDEEMVADMRAHLDAATFAGFVRRFVAHADGALPGALAPDAGTPAETLHALAGEAAMLGAAAFADALRAAETDTRADASAVRQAHAETLCAVWAETRRVYSERFPGSEEPADTS